MAAVSDRMSDYEIVSKWEDTEHAVEAESKAAAAAADEEGWVKVAKPSKLKAKYFHEVGAHSHGIYAMTQVGDRIFTGSKDGWIKSWDLDGSKYKVVYQPELNDPVSVISALLTFGENQLISATETGNVDLWHKDGRHIHTIPAAPSYYQHDDADIAINCLSQGSFRGKPIFFVGWPAEFTVHQADQKEERALSSCNTSKEDSVFSVTQVSEQHHLVASLDRLELFTTTDHYRSWKQTRSLIKGSPNFKKPEIILDVNSQTINTFALALFNGEVSVFDLEKGTKSHVFREHKLKVWRTVNLPDYKLFASCSSDGTVKLWDLNQKKSVKTIDNMASVTSLLYIGDSRLVSATHSEDSKGKGLAARLQFWDIRKT